MMLIGAEVAAYLGQGDDAQVVALADVHLPVVTAQVRAYTRGRGFYPVGVDLSVPGDDINAVILSATARAVSNPAVGDSETIGSYTVRHGTVNGWTLPELAILHAYRRRAA